MKQGWVWRVVATAVVLVVLWAAYWAVATYALSRALTDCDNAVLQESSSTDSQLIATVFERGCGATSPFARIVSVRASGTAFDGEDRERWVFTIEGRPDVGLTWTGPRHLAVKYGGGGGRVARQAVIWYGVTISYE